MLTHQPRKNVKTMSRKELTFLVSCRGEQEHRVLLQPADDLFRASLRRSPAPACRGARQLSVCSDARGEVPRSGGCERQPGGQGRATSLATQASAEEDLEPVHNKQLQAIDQFNPLSTVLTSAARHICHRHHAFTVSERVKLLQLTTFTEIFFKNILLSQ